jgi:hypothetical protein
MKEGVYDINSLVDTEFAMFTSQATLTIKPGETTVKMVYKGKTYKSVVDGLVYMPYTYDNNQFTNHWAKGSVDKSMSSGFFEVSNNLKNVVTLYDVYQSINRVLVNNNYYAMKTSREKVDLATEFCAIEGIDDTNVRNLLMYLDYDAVTKLLCNDADYLLSAVTREQVAELQYLIFSSPVGSKGVIYTPDYTPKIYTTFVQDNKFMVGDNTGELRWEDCLTESELVTILDRIDKFTAKQD